MGLVAVAGALAGVEPLPGRAVRRAPQTRAPARGPVVLQLDSAATLQAAVDRLNMDIGSFWSYATETSKRRTL